MSIRVKLSDLTPAQKNDIAKNVVVKPPPTKYNMNPKPLECLRLDGGYAYIPFHYGMQFGKPEQRANCTSSSHYKPEAHKLLYSEQVKIVEDVKKQLNKSNTSTMALHTGFGKCFAPGTMIMMRDGTSKPVEKIRNGDYVMGHDSTAKLVSGKVKGVDEMYKISYENGNSYTVNREHILCVKTMFKIVEMENKICLWVIDKENGSFVLRNYFYGICESQTKERAVVKATLLGNKKMKEVTITVEEYLKLDPLKQSLLLGYRNPVNFIKSSTSMHPYTTGIVTGMYYNPDTDHMSTEKKKNIMQEYETLDEREWCRSHPVKRCYETTDLMTRRSYLAGIVDSSGGVGFKGYYILYNTSVVFRNHIVKIIYSLGMEVVEVTDGIIWFQGEELMTRLSENYLYNPDFINHSRTYRFTITLEKDAGVYHGFTISGKEGKFLLQDGTVVHNTRLSIHMCNEIKLKTVVFINNLVELLKQWKHEIDGFYGFDNSLIVKPSTRFDEEGGSDVDFFIINARNVEKIDSRFLKGIGSCVVDELHLMATKTLVKCVQHVTPRYLIGLSATPYREDGMDKVLDLYFGKDNKIYRKMFHQHYVNVLFTGIKIPNEYTHTGGINWGAVLAKQAENVERNEMVAKIVNEHPKRKILIFCKRLDQTEQIHDILKTKYNIDSTLVTGSKKKYDYDSTNVFIGIIKKIGVGFSLEKLDMLIMAADALNYFQQYLGRVFRRKDVVPIIYDVVDDNGILYKHYKERFDIYKNSGGEIYEHRYSDFSKPIPKHTFLTNN